MNLPLRLSVPAPDTSSHHPRGDDGAVDGDVPAAVEFLIVYGSAEAAKSQGCDENGSHCAYFTKIYASRALNRPRRSEIG